MCPQIRDWHIENDASLHNTPHKSASGQAPTVSARRVDTITRAGAPMRVDWLARDGAVFVWFEDISDEGMMERPDAERIHHTINGALVDLRTWQHDHPAVADWRIEEAVEHLTRAKALLGYLRDDTDPQGECGP